MVFYFTATGNSLYVAKEVDAQPVSIAQAIHDPNKIYQADSIGIVCPVFGHEMPELVKEFLKISRFESCSPTATATAVRRNWQRRMWRGWASTRTTSMSF